MANRAQMRFEYLKPSNIESTVPERQKLRESVETSEMAIQKPTSAAGMKADNPEDNVFSPVLTVTKDEATFVKGDMKLQKVSVTENLSPPRCPDIHSEVIRDHQPIRIHPMNAKGRDSIHDRKRTRIPKLRFREAVERVKRERRDSKEESGTQPRKSSIPRLVPKSIAHEKHETTIELPNETPDDEFDKIYDEIVDSPVDISVNLLNSKVKDPVAIENKFEEIIHAYEDNNENQTPTDISKHSKIPKRKSEPNISVTKNIKRFENITHNQTDIDSTKSAKDPTSTLRSPSRIGVLKKSISEYGDSNNNKATQNNKPVRTLFPLLRSQSENNSNLTKIDSNESRIPEPLNAINNKKLRKDTLELVQTNQKGEIEVKIANCHNNNESNIEETIQPNNPDTHRTMLCNILDPISINSTEKHLSSFEIINLEGQETLSAAPEFKSVRQNSDNKDDTLKSIDSVTKIFDNLENKRDDFKKELDAEVSIKSVHSKIAMFEQQKPPNAIFNTHSKGLKHKPVSKIVHIDKKVNENKPMIVEKVLKPRPRDVNYNYNLNNRKKYTVFEKDSTPDDVFQIRDIEVSTAEIIDTNELKSNSKFKEKPVQFINQQETKDVAVFYEPTINNKNEQTNSKEKLPADSFLCNSSTIVKDINDKMLEGETIPAYDPDAHDSRIPVEKHESTIDIINLEGQEIAPAASVYKITRQVMGDLKNESDHSQKNYDKNIPITKSVHSKISLFERQKPANTIPNTQYNASKYNTPPMTVDTDKNFNNKPLIVEEVLNLKPSPRNDDGFDKEQELTSFKENTTTNDIFQIHDIGVSTAEVVDVVEVDDSKLQNNTNEITHSKNKPELINQEKIKDLPYDNDNQQIDSENNDKLSVDTNNSNSNMISQVSDDKLLPNVKANSYDAYKKVESSDLDLGDTVKGKVHEMIIRMNSSERLDTTKTEVISLREKPREKSVFEKIALFESKLTKVSRHAPTKNRPKDPSPEPVVAMESNDELQSIINELNNAKKLYGTTEMKYTTLSNGIDMPVLALGTASLKPPLLEYVISAAIELGYRAIDTAYIHNNEKEVGEAIRKKIEDGTVRREDLFITSKLWSTFHRTDLVEKACRASLDTMGLTYFDQYLIHNPMSFKEGPNPYPRIAGVLQYSQHDYLDAWFGVERLAAAGLVRSVGVCNFSADQLQRVLEKAKVKPVVNQVESHPYLTQHKLQGFCNERNVTLVCFGVLGSRGDAKDYCTSANDDPLIQVIAAGLQVTPAQLLISYHLHHDRAVVVQASSAARLFENLGAVNVQLKDAELAAVGALNRNKRHFTFKGAGDTHRNYPFKAAF